MAWLSLMMVMITGTYSVPQYTSDNQKVEAYMGQDVTLTFESLITPAELITEVTIVQQRADVKRILFHCLRKRTRNPCINYFISNIEVWSSNNFTVFHIAIKEVSFRHIGTYSCNYYNFSGILVEIENTIVDIWDRFFVVHKYVGMVTLQFFLRSQHSKQSIDNTVILLLLELAKQIVDGLEFLALNECCHPGLSSKIILVDPRGNCKLYNFWLLNDASEVLEQCNLVEEHSVLTSLSPEALLIGEYVSASDARSLGMTLWEVFSLGKNPYPGITVCKVKENPQNFKEKKPTKPMIISDEIYSVLRSCWVQRVTKRFAVTKIKEKLKAATSSFLQERESFDTTHSALEDVQERQPLNE